MQELLRGGGEEGIPLSQNLSRPFYNSSWHPGCFVEIKGGGSFFHTLSPVHRAGVGRIFFDYRVLKNELMFVHFRGGVISSEDLNKWPEVCGQIFIVYKYMIQLLTPNWWALIYCVNRTHSSGFRLSYNYEPGRQDFLPFSHILPAGNQLCSGLRTLY